MAKTISTCQIALKYFFMIVVVSISLFVCNGSGVVKGNSKVSNNTTKTESVTSIKNFCICHGSLCKCGPCI